MTQRIYTAREDGLYGPAVDANFATNKWVYLYYSPQTVTDVKLSRRLGRHADHAEHHPAERGARPRPRGTRTSATSSSARFKFVDDADGTPAHLDLGSEQQIMRVPNNRQECCHVAGDIDFDKHGNLWIVTGDDTPAGGINAGGYGPFNDQKTDEQQTVRVTNATGGTFTLTFEGQTTAPIAFNATAAQIDAALEALSNIEADEIQTSGGPANTANVNVFFRRAQAAVRPGADHRRRRRPDRHRHADGRHRPRRRRAAGTSGPTGDSRRSRAEHQRPARQGPPHQGQGRRHRRRRRQQGRLLGSGTGAYTIPAGQPVPARRGRAAGQDAAGDLRDGLPQPVPHPGRRERRRLHLRLLARRADAAARAAARRAPAARDRRASRPTTAGRRATSADLGVLRVELPRVRARHHHGRHAAGRPAAAVSTATAPTPAQRLAAGTSTAARASSPACATPAGHRPGHLVLVPRQQRARTPLGTPCRATTSTTPGPIAPGSTTECPRLFPELYTGGVGPHGVAKYHFDPANPNTKKFPPYYDDSVILGEFGQDTLRELKLDGRTTSSRSTTSWTAAQANIGAGRSRSSATTRWTCSGARTARSTC